MVHLVPTINYGTFNVVVLNKIIDYIAWLLPNTQLKYKSTILNLLMKSLYAFRFLMLIFLLTNLTNECIAQNIHLVKDLNFATNSTPANLNELLLNNTRKRNGYAILNGVSYFSADDGVNGRGFWRSDGTSAGTYQLKEGINPTNITSLNGKLYFAGTGNIGLWVSDGTAAGTVPLLTKLPSGLSSFVPAGLTDFNGALVFVVRGTTPNDQLWKTDGTAQGTVLVKDFYNPDPAKSFRDLLNLIVVKNKIFFRAYKLSPGYTVRTGVSDGSASGTYILSEDLVEPSQMTDASANDPLVYFSASTSFAGPRTLYATNGDSANVTKVSGFNGIIANNNYFTTEIIGIADVLYFLGQPDDTTKTASLYKFDIKAANGIQPVKIVTGINANGIASYVYNLTNVDGTLYFNVYDAVKVKNELWKSNGESGGNLLLKDSLSGSNFTMVNGVVYFTGFDNKQGTEIWRTDGTANGTSIIKDISEGLTSSGPNALTPFNGKVVFAADDGVHGNELWISDGTADGTALVKDMNQTSSPGSNINSLTPFNDTLVFSAVTYTASGLWKSDGTSNGTKIICDTINSSLVSYPNTQIIRFNHIFFYGRSISGKEGIYKIDLISQKATLLKDFTGFSIYSFVPIATDSLIYFPVRNNSTAKTELWRTDGTAANTFVVKNDFTDFSSHLVVAAGSNLFFIIENSTSLWKTDGTITGTVMVKSFYTSPYFLAAYNGMLYFGAYTFDGAGLWRSDGTAAGTIQLSGSVDSPQNFAPSNGKLFFIARANSDVYGNIGIELFKTDGTISGTVLVKDIHSGGGSTTIYKSINVGGTLYFFTNPTSTAGIELWKSDGTTTGTQLISMIAAGTAGIPNALVACNGNLFFMVGNILWQSNGVASGTHPVHDNILSSLTLRNNNLTATQNKLFFIASNYTYGEELYVANVSPQGVINYTTVADGNWNNPAIWADNMVPSPGASVVINNAVIVNVNVTCNSVFVEPAGSLTVNPGIILKVLQ